MATIRELPSGKFKVQVRGEDHPPESATFDTRKQAERWAAKIETEIDEGKHFGYARIKRVIDAIDTFQKAPSTIKTADDRNRHLGWWPEHFGNRKLFHFDAEEGRALLATENLETDPKEPPRHRSP